MTFRELVSLLKNTPYTCFHSRSGTKYAVFRGVLSPICGRYQLNADFFNRLWSYRQSGEWGSNRL
jgi:hypothetical protein